MRRLLSAVAVLASAFLVVACTQLWPVAQPSPATVRQAIENANARFVEAFNRGDAAAVASFYVEDAKVLPPNSPMVTGTERIQEFWQGFIATGAKLVSLQIEEVQYKGTLAYELGAYTVTIPSGAAQVQALVPKPLTDTGKYVVIWRRQTDGSWKLAVDIWNSNMPAGN